jgi:hypothetical protein
MHRSSALAPSFPGFCRQFLFPLKNRLGLRRAEKKNYHSLRQLFSVTFREMETQNTPRVQRQFAPLKPPQTPEPSNHNVPVLEGIVFDVDGTLCK